MKEIVQVVNEPSYEAPKLSFAKFQVHHYNCIYRGFNKDR